MEKESNKTKKKKVEKKSVEHVEEIIVHDQVECKYCHKKFDKGLRVCPHCRKNQKDKVGPIVITTLSVILLICIVGSYFVDKYMVNAVSEDDYKASCELVSYEQLVRSPKDYKNDLVKIIGTVESVTGTDTGYSNDMEITINSNLFDDGDATLITVGFDDCDYSQGFIAGDTITVYGEYTAINGNIPYIEAKYIVFGE